VRRYLIRRLLQGIPVLFVVSVLVFLVLNLLPGDPVMARQGAFMDANYTQLMATLKHQMGLDRPLPERYAIWVWHALQGDFGVSYITQNSVAGLIAQKLPATLELTVLSIVVALLVAIPAGILAAVRPNSWLDLAVTGFVTMGLAIPGFWLGMMLMILFAVRMGLLPAVGYTPLAENPGDNLRHVVMPAVTLAIILAAPVMRFLRSSLLDVLGQEYITTARSKGLAQTVVISRHALRNALIPTITVIGLQFANLLSGVVIIEWLFAWPGMGWLTVDAVQNRDYSVVQASVILMATGFVLVNLAVDVLYAVFDPRIRYS
jgi:peptide/nickel transport system permease protein